MQWTKANDDNIENKQTNNPIMIRVKKEDRACGYRLKVRAC